MKLSPSWEAANYAATQKLQHSMESEGSLPCSQKPSTGFCPEPDRSSPYHPILSFSLRCILIFFTHYVLVFLVVSFFLASPPISYMHSFFSHSCRMPCPSDPPWLDHSNYTWRRVQVMKLLVNTCKHIRNSVFLVVLHLTYLLSCPRFVKEGLELRSCFSGWMFHAHASCS
jgi:hypothetical protein